MTNVKLKTNVSLKGFKLNILNMKQLLSRINTKIVLSILSLKKQITIKKPQITLHIYNLNWLKFEQYIPDYDK